LLTADEARTRGDATPDQRAELRALIRSKTVTDEWVSRFYRDICQAGGLSRGRANAALIYLRGLADKTDHPTYATTDQTHAIRGLIRTRLVPGHLANMWLDRLAAGTMTHDEARNTLADLHRAALRTFVAPDGARRTTDAAPDGFFALTGKDRQPHCYRIFTLPGGGRRVDRITGDTPMDYHRLRGWQASGVMRAVALDVEAAAALYGKTRRRCSDCDQPLDPAAPGFEQGYSPDCWAARQEVAAANTPTVPPENLTDQRSIGA